MGILDGIDKVLSPSFSSRKELTDSLRHISLEIENKKRILEDEELMGQFAVGHQSIMNHKSKIQKIKNDIETLYRMYKATARKNAKHLSDEQIEFLQSQGLL